MNFRIFFEEQNEVLAHIAGPAGVGKTTLMNKIKSSFPQVSVVDLDEFDKFANRKQNLTWNWRDTIDWNGAGQNQFAKSHVYRQGGMDKFVNNSKNMKRLTILFGIHLEDSTEYKFHTSNRLYLMRPVADIVKDRVKRDGDHYRNMGQPFDEKEAYVNFTKDVNDVVSQLQAKGYEPLPIGNAFNYISSLIQANINVDATQT